MLENTQNCTQTDDEISLIDLFSVLIRYRKLIVAGTFSVAFLTGLYLFVLPKIVPSMNKATQTVYYTFDVEQLPRSLADQLQLNVKDSAVSCLQDAKIFAELNRKYNLFADSRLVSEESFNASVRAILDEKKSFVVEPQDNTRNVKKSANEINLVCSVSANRAKILDEFMADLVAQTERHLEDLILPKVQRLQETSAAIVEKYGFEASSSSSSSSSSLLRYGDILADSMLVLNNNAHFIYQADDKSGGGHYRKSSRQTLRGAQKSLLSRFSLRSSFWFLLPSL
jgi:hypothetical protein